MSAVKQPCLTVRLRYDPARGDDPVVAKALDTFLFGEEKRKARAVRAALHHSHHIPAPTASSIVAKTIRAVQELRVTAVCQFQVGLLCQCHQFRRDGCFQIRLGT